ncbi:MAG: ribosome maturation factor RimM [Bacteroidota bacterium]|nr:ribosome maturation factor RimM [Bacteroidota bacterium]
MLDINNFIAIGKITKTIGIKGNLKIISLTDFPERFLKLKKIFLYNEISKQFFINNLSSRYEFNISECKIYDKCINLKLEDYDSIEKSSELINLILMIDESQRVKLDDGSYYFYELVDSEIFDKGNPIGKIVSVVNYGSGDLFNVTSGGKEILIPYRKEFVKSIDVKNKRIDVDLIDGFLE